MSLVGKVDAGHSETKVSAFGIPPLCGPEWQRRAPVSPFGALAADQERRRATT
jgi:hypothetical protein